MRGPVRILRPSRLKWVLMTLGSGLFVAGSWLFLDGWWRWLGVGFFGVGVIVSVLTLIPGNAFLEVRPDGFTVRSLFRSFGYRWSEIARFHVARTGSSRFVAFDFAPDHEAYRTLRKVVALLFRHEASLPDTYGMKCEELVEFLNRQKENASADLRQ